MRDADKTKDQLLREMSDMRHRVAELEEALSFSYTTDHGPPEDTTPSGHLAERLRAEIDKRKQAEERLRASRERLASIFRAAPTGIGFSLGSVMMEVNNVLCTMTGYTKQELIGQNGRILYATDEDYNSVHEGRYRQMADHGIGAVETRWQRKDGAILDVLLSSAPVDPGDLSKGVTFTAVDITERKRAEGALAKELSRRKVLLEQLPDGILMIDTETTRFLEFNTAAHTQLGYSREEFAGLSIFDVEAKETADETVAHIATVIRNGKDDFETTQRTKQGEIRNVHVTAQLIDTTGGPVYHCIWRDITDRKMAEKALSESESKFRALAENSTAVIFVVQADKYVYTNPSFTAVTGYTRQDLLSMDFWDLISPDMRELVRTRGMARQKKEDPPSRYDLRFITKSGEERYGNFAATLIEFQGGPAILGSVVDITERKRMEDTLREREKTLQAVFDAVHETMVLIDTEGTVMVSNRVGAERLDKTVPDLVGTYVYDYFPPDVAASRKERYDRVVTTAQPVYFEDTRRGRSFEHYCYPVFDEGGRVSGVAIFARDITDRKQAEEELQKSEEKYRSIFENAVEGFYQTTPGGRFLSVNPALSRMMGFATPEEMIATYTDIGKQHYVDPQDRVRFRTLLEQQGDVQAFETRLRRRDGNSIWVSMTGRAVKDVQGKVLHFEGTIEDITDRKNDEEALRLSEEKFAKAFAMNPAVFAITSLEDGRVIEVNETGLKTFGYSRDEAIGASSLLLWPTPADRARFVRELQEKRFIRSSERTLVRRSGEPFTALASAELLTLAGEEVILSTWLDIEDRIRAEQELRESEERFRSLVERAPEAIFVQARGRFLYANPAMLNLLGASNPEQVLGKEVFTWVAPEYHESVRARMSLQLETGKVAPPVEREYLRFDGSRVHVESMAVPVRFTGVVAHLVFVRDITERNSLQAQLLQSQKMEAIGTLAGGVAHDFNNILMALMGYASLVEMGIPKDHPVKTYVDQIHSCTSKAANLTQSLLAFSRKQVMELSPRSLSTTVKDLENLLRRLVPEDIDLTVHTGDDVTIMADMTQIDQVLINLVSNAKDAMPKGGKLIIETKAVELGRDFRQAHGFGEPGTYALISVADTGSGMDEATQKKIFEPFFTTKEVGKGTGLGLSIVYGIIKQHGGYITVSSKPERGATFCLYLPVVKGKVSETGKPPAVVEGGTETLLLAEDSQDVRTVAKEILCTSGYAVVEAEDGHDAVRRYIQHRDRIDLLILDVVMPGMNGKEAYDEIRKINPSVRAIFMSGYTGDVVLDKGIRNTVIDYISKPLSADELLSKIREVLDR